MLHGTAFYFTTHLARYIFFLNLTVDTATIPSFPYFLLQVEALAERVEHLCSAFQDNRHSGVEGIARLLYNDLREILRAGLFRAGWEDSVKCVTSLRGIFQQNFTALQLMLCAESRAGAESAQQILVISCEAVVSLYLEVMLTSPTLQMNMTTMARLSEDLELITKLFDEWRERIYNAADLIKPHIVDSIGKNKARNKSGFLQKLGAKGEGKQPRQLSVVRIQTGKLGLGEGSGAAAREGDGSGKRSGGGGGFFGGKRVSTGIISSGGNNSKTDSSAVGEQGGDADDGEGGYQSSHGEVEAGAGSAVSAWDQHQQQQRPSLGTAAQQGDVRASKDIFNLILQPLAHVVLAVQMNNQYLPDFVRSELYKDFGPYCVNIWQLIMHWRGEQRDDVAAAYERLFSPRAAAAGATGTGCLEFDEGDGRGGDAGRGSEEFASSVFPPLEVAPLLQIPYITKVKPANVVRL